MAKSRLCSKEELINDLRTVLDSGITEFNKIYGGRGKLALVDTKTNQVIESFGYSEKPIDQFNISEMDVSYYMLLLHCYVTEGRITKRLYQPESTCALFDEYPFVGSITIGINSQWKIIDNHIVKFFRGLEPIFTDDQYSLKNILHIIDLSLARRRLDFNDFFKSEENSLDVIPGYLTLKDIALLAGVDMKTVRNLAIDNDKLPVSLRLFTEGDKKSKGKTLVKLDHAKEWLNKRGYKSTQTYDPILDIPISKFTRGFEDINMLNDYVRYQCDKRRLSFKQLANLAELSIDDPINLGSELNQEQYFNSLKFDPNNFHEIDILGRIAKILGFDKWEFISAAVATQHNENMRRIHYIREQEYSDELNAADFKE